MHLRHIKVTQLFNSFLYPINLLAFIS